MPPLVTLLTDFGTRDPWVAICKGVILGIAPDVRLLDITHDVAAFAVREGALTLAAVLPELPIGIHLAVVDPGVGTARRGIAIRVGRGDLLVGPDNGLLLPAAEALGGPVDIHEIQNGRYRREAASRTFHGRDVFAPAAAWLATGIRIEELGPRLLRGDLVELEFARAERLTGLLRTAVIAIDTYGNVSLAGGRSDLEAATGPLERGDALLVAPGTHEHGAPGVAAAWASTFGDVGHGTILVYEDSLRRLAVAVNQGSAAVRLALGPGDPVVLRRTT
jgi:S-adenosylmethionine hydrolase